MGKYPKVIAGEYLSAILASDCDTPDALVVGTPCYTPSGKPVEIAEDGIQFRISEFTSMTALTWEEARRLAGEGLEARDVLVHFKDTRGGRCYPAGELKVPYEALSNARRLPELPGQTIKRESAYYEKMHLLKAKMVPAIAYNSRHVVLESQSLADARTIKLATDEELCRLAESLDRVKVRQRAANRMWAKLPKLSLILSELWAEWAERTREQPVASEDWSLRRFLESGVQLASPFITGVEAVYRGQRVTLSHLSYTRSLDEGDYEATTQLWGPMRDALANRVSLDSVKAHVTVGGVKSLVEPTELFLTKECLNAYVPTMKDVPGVIVAARRNLFCAVDLKCVEVEGFGERNVVLVPDAKGYRKTVKADMLYLLTGEQLSSLSRSVEAVKEALGEVEAWWTERPTVAEWASAACV